MTNILDRNPLDLDESEFPEYLAEWRRVEQTHSWLYGSRTVYCTMCGTSKNAPEARKECRAFRSH